MPQPPVDIFYVVPLGAVIAWYPLPNQQPPTKLPPNFAVCDGKTVSDPDSPYNGLATPNLTYRFPLGASEDMAPNQQGGEANFNVNGWSGMLTTTSTQAGSVDDAQNVVIQHNGVSSTKYRFSLSDDNDSWNDGNHHHSVTVTIPAPGWVALVYIMRIK